ncbi:SMI1/KNR4 family protein [Flavobacterium sp. RSSB_23]|uniref:SMI1/KNR4 family protein n=1 Tax=Flavobacterium sp. RSSB_23 TaxID=3447668 RepID=UPI003F2E79EB
MNTNYKLESEFLGKVEDDKDETNKKELLSEEQLNKIIEKYPNVPLDYISYLREIGSGNFRECQFKVQSFLFNLEDLGLDNHYDIKSNIWFFGDNYCGDFSGFDLDLYDGLVVEFWHETGELYYTNQTFQNYIRQQIGMDENGNDTLQ